MRTAPAKDCRRTGKPIWRGSIDVSDKRAQTGAAFGDGSTLQGWQIIYAIRDAALAWFRDERTIVDENGKPLKLRYDYARTLEAVLSFMDFVTGKCVATYEMIARKADICRRTALRHMALFRSWQILDWQRQSNDLGQAPNDYIFEISRLPAGMQESLRKSLKRKRLKLESRPERKGSGPVPNRAQRLAERLAKGFVAAAQYVTGGQHREDQMQEAAFIASETALLADIPTAQWAVIRHPGDPAAQAAYNERLGIFFDLEGDRKAPDSGDRDKDKRS